jgi:hypothetical protein
VAISTNRIVKRHLGQVTVSYKESATDQLTQATVTAIVGRLRATRILNKFRLDLAHNHLYDQAV